MDPMLLAVRHYLGGEACGLERAGHAMEKETSAFEASNLGSSQDRIALFLGTP